jgi:hypothetical protein
LEDVGIGGSVMAKMDLNEQDGRVLTRFIWFMIDTSGRLLYSCERGNEPVGFIKCGEFLDQLRNC